MAWGRVGGGEGGGDSGGEDILTIFVSAHKRGYELVPQCMQEKKTAWLV